MSEFSTPPLEPGIKPGKVQAVTIMLLANGILNILYALGVTGSIVLGTLGIGLICAPLTILPGVLGVFEIIYATNLMAMPPKTVKNLQTIAILEIVCVISGNAISLVVGILNLVFYNDPEVRGYLTSHQLI
ncbi:MAG: hypothetical protein ABFD44_11770 [Anaerolineaceae bacterium]